mmetsp:Transcript_37101/g.57994  ORF Transcript_37101/g.57994 Transcript_37101/m.57994 type:complete len:110 (-) Transcript_37101:28-357(-)
MSGVDPYYVAKMMYPDGSKKPVDDSKEKLLQLKNCINRLSRVTLTDGRVLTGTFICFDYQGNVLMNGAEEQKAMEGNKDSRSLGMIMVKPQHLVKFEAEEPEEGSNLTL